MAMIMIVIVTVTDYADYDDHSDGYIFTYLDTIVENKPEAVTIVKRLEYRRWEEMVRLIIEICSTRLNTEITEWRHFIYCI